LFVEKLRPYVPGKSASQLAQRLHIPVEAIDKLNANENVYGCSPSVIDAIKQLELKAWSTYPDPDCRELTEKLANFHQIPAESVVVGPGSVVIIGDVAKMVLEPGTSTVYPAHAFQGWGIAASKAGATAIPVHSPTLEVDLDKILRAIDDRTRAIYLDNPGNPTGRIIEPGKLKEFLKAVPEDIAVVLDAAYHEFVPKEQRADLVALVKEFPNVIVLGTFSKAYGLASFRLGYALAPQNLATGLLKLREPFSVSTAAQTAGLAALRAHEFLDMSVALNAEGRQQLQAGLERLGLRYEPSSTNFVLIHVGDGQGTVARAEQQAIMLRFTGTDKLPGSVRVTIGKREQNQKVLAFLKQELVAGRITVAGSEAAVRDYAKPAIDES
jgi:histidinol-phosphate aminotransferase